MSVYNSKYKKEKSALDKATYEHSLWKRLEGKELNQEQMAFISQCLSENLEHARHVENERLTFNSIFLALAAGALAFAGAFTSWVAFAIYFCLAIAGFLSMLLTARWNNAFSRHLFYAQECYKLIHTQLFGNGDEGSKNDSNSESLNGLNDLPIYCFKIHRPIAYTAFGDILFRPKTRNLYIAFYWIIQILLIGCALVQLAKIFM